MQIDLDSINPDIDLGVFKQLLGDKTHFIYELVQNADDSESTLLGLRLYENELFVWNDGRPFNQGDVQSICSTGSSDKDLTQIGNFGFGFKSVYNYTDLPEIYSNDVCFRIPYLKKPEAIDMDPRAAKLINKNATVVFRLPFKDSLLPEDITNLENHLCNLEKRRSLLFLRHLTTIQWDNKRNGQVGSYFSVCPDKRQNPSQVKLKASVGGESPLSETFMVFHNGVRPQEDVIDRLQDQAENWKEEDRIQRSREELQSIEIAFKLQDGKITTLDGCVLFAYLPTEIKTNLRFLIQARYQTTPPRENIVKPSESLWNRWLLQETANFLPEVLGQLKDCGLLDPMFFNVLPLKEDDVPEEFELIVEAWQKAMRERAFVPTEKEGHYAQAENVFYPDSKDLRELVKSSGMHPDSSLLHPDIQESGRCFKVMAEAGIKKIDKSDLLFWLEKQSHDWFKRRTHKWMRSLYAYFKKKWSPTELERIKKLPLVRLENGKHVCTNDQLVFFPPDTDKDLEEIKPLLNDLSILKSTLLRKEDYNDIKEFLEDIGVEDLRPENLITKSICPLYNQPNKPLIRKNRRHVRYIFKSWQKTEGPERKRLEENISQVPILRAYKGIEKEVSNFVVPRNTYLPQAYTVDNDLETYFSVSDGAPWFVDDKYLTKNSDTKAWLQFLKAIGAMDTLQVLKRNIPVDDKECNKRSIQRSTITRAGEETIEDHSLYGLSVVLNEISEHRNVKLSQVLWSLLVKALPLAEQERETFFKKTYKGTYRSKYRSNSYTESDHFDAEFYRQLKSMAWIPDEQGNLRSPNECFRPNSENQEILGNRVTYVHSDFDMSTRPAQWLAKKLDVRLEADADNVLNYLQTLSQRKASREASIEKVEPIYKFLESKSEDADLWKFGEESLIFTPEPEPRWWRADEVFWEDESPVFGDARGYLKTYYSEDLKSFFTDSLEVQKRADTAAYVHGIRDITSKGKAETKEIRARVQKLYRCLWRSLQENGDSLEAEEWQEEWERVRKGACWLGREGDEWGFFSPQKLVWNDHPYLARIFEGKVPFWGFTDELLELAKDSGIEGCSQARIKFLPSGYGKNDEIWSRKVQDLRSCIRAFLKSSHLCDRPVDEKSLEVLSQLSVRRVEKLEVTYELNDIPIIDLVVCHL